MPACQDVIEQLQDYLDPLADYPDALSAIASHGFLTALTIGKVLPDPSLWLSELLGVEEALSEVQCEHLLDPMKPILATIDQSFNEDEGFTWPACVANDYSNAVQDWCTGFMVAQMLQQAHWFANDEAHVSELLLPIMLGSGLFDEMDEFCDIARQSELVDDMLQQIPQVVTELYLYFHA